MESAGLTWELVAQLRDANYGVPYDVTFKFGDDEEFEVVGADDVVENVRAHKLILALASNKFKDLFYTTYPGQNVFNIEDISESVFCAMISFIYGAKESLTGLRLMELMELSRVAEEYKVVGLVEAVTEAIESNTVSEENLRDTVKEVLLIDPISDTMLNHCSRLIKSNIKNDRIEVFIKSLNQNEIMCDKLNDAMNYLVTQSCTNCLSTPCLNNTTVPNTINVMPGCKVAVKNNNCPDYWGTAPLAQQGEVRKIPSPQMVVVAWCDGSESEYNVHLTRNIAEPQLVYHCGAVGA